MLPFIPNQKSKIGFYFHIPFCPHICPYCDFTKTNRFSKNDVEAYFQELYHSLDNVLLDYSQEYQNLNTTHCTVYFGGGTPSLFSAKFYSPILEKLSKRFELEEITIETNPFSNKKNFIKEYCNIGIHRVTLGAQSLCENTLHTLGRKHTKEDVLNNICWLREANIEQVQVDLIYGLNTERSMRIEDEIKTIISTGGTGISAYGLTLESRTVFAQSTNQIIDENKAVEEYESILNTCSELKLRQIETSNFSFFDAKHNNLYWYGYPYFGLGTGAHGLLPPTSKNPYGIRYKVGAPLQEYNPGNDILKFDNTQNIAKNFQLIFESSRTKSEMLEELIFTLLRTEKGIPLDWLASVFDDRNILQSKILSHAQIKRAIEENKIKISPSHIALSPLEKIRGDAWALIFISSLL